MSIAVILEYGEEQYKCLHKGWGKTNDGMESYWKCTDCGATLGFNESHLMRSKTEPTPIPEYMQGVHSDPIGEFRGALG